MGVIELLLLSIGLAMDAFAVSVCKGISMKKINCKKSCIIGLWFGGFQALMPTIGYFLGSAFESLVTNIDHWIAFILLGIIGGNMIKEAFCKEKEKTAGGEEMSDLRNVSSNPHIRAKDTTSRIMLTVVIALLLPAFFGIYNFGFRALVLILISIATCVLTEYIYEKLMKKPITIGDFSAVVTGLLLALNLPVSVPFWIPVVGGVFAILVVKMLFGGLGQNFMNPALAGRCFLLISFTSLMTNFNCDAYTGATPLASLKAGESVNVLNMILGRTAGTIGETSVIAIVLGACVLIVAGVIDLRVPGSYIASFAVFVLLFAALSGIAISPAYLSAQLAGGGLMLGAFFMATDYVTRPVTKKGQYIYGVILGFLTAIFRIFGASAEGVSYAIILGNLLVPLIERYTMPKAFGKGGERS